MAVRRRHAYALPSEDAAERDGVKARLRVDLLIEERAALVREIVATQERLLQLDARDRALAVKLKRAQAILAEGFADAANDDEDADHA